MSTLLVEDRLVFDDSDEENGLDGLEGSVQSRILFEVHNKDRNELFIAREIETRAAAVKAMRIRAFRLEGVAWKAVVSTYRKSDHEGNGEIKEFKASKSSVAQALSFLRWRQELEPNVSFFFERPGNDFPELVSDVADELEELTIEGPASPTPATAQEPQRSFLKRFFRRRAA
jgi:hypothetical protein